ncbi:Uncharacterised protein [Mycobacterium tuberculosis]|uniref:Uncharacterized protein n=1 Tax=Mycobacterium tuberculosis TaxID=1773 RepID=A0A655DZM5_MYCTX|nr:Uncharacterised protein [Mycobacterium tuberculosis]CNU93879.1 Uncharacterised protein [Mycobacterium tuberculosis]
MVRRGSSRKLNVPSISTRHRLDCSPPTGLTSTGARTTRTNRNTIATTSPMATPSSRLRNTTHTMVMA